MRSFSGLWESYGAVLDVSSHCHGSRIKKKKTSKKVTDAAKVELRTFQSIIKRLKGKSETVIFEEEMWLEKKF